MERGYLWTVNRGIIKRVNNMNKKNLRRIDINGIAPFDMAHPTFQMELTTTP